uniref:Uncharacterized protein n=1 Tax=uncultured marine virus TaxID=186617 RepID=A0A0F7L4S4_9VIRU|nr:hypothetical protein [uncultured marine virus]
MYNMFTFLNHFKKIDLPPNIKDGHGFQEITPKEADFILGGRRQALKTILSPERDYSDYLPVHETQKRGFDSFSCVVFSGLNNLEIIFKKQFGFGINYSDRYIAGLIPVKPNYGTNYSKFWDAVREYGLVLEEEYPWGGNNGYEYVVRPPEHLILKGKEVLKDFDIQHEWVDSGGCDPNVLWEALQFGPLQASVNAAATYDGRVSRGTNHSITIYKAIKGKKFFIQDHYRRETYTVPWNFYFGSAKQATLIKKKLVPLVQTPFEKDKHEASKVYAIYGTTACHIEDEYTWAYGSKIGIWEQDKITPLPKPTFDARFTIGDAIKFNH